MKTVWVVEKGQYSDYRVVGVYSTKENAQRICDALNGEDGPNQYDAASIAQWPLDPAINELNQGMGYWSVHMLRNGDTERVQLQEFPAYGFDSEFSIWRRSTAPAYKGRNIPDIFTARVWATDERHAVKIVNEKRAEWIALDKWPADFPEKKQYK